MSDQDSGDRRESRRGRIAVIDDESGIGEIVRRALRRQYDVEIFERGRDFVKVVDDGLRFDVIFCDLFLPGLSGREIYEKYRERYPDRAKNIVFMSGISVEEAREEILNGLDNRLLRKPFRLNELRDAAESVLDS